MTNPHNSLTRRRVCLLSAWGTAAALLVAGCQQDEIQRYRAAKPEPPAPAAPEQTAAPGEKGSVRMLAAILPQGERSWFVKLVGPTDAVAPYTEAFEQFVRSLRLTGNADRP